MKKCVTSIFAVIAFLLLNVTNVYANSISHSFTLRYIKGAPSSTCTEYLSMQAYGGGIVINVRQLTAGAKLSVSSSNINPRQTVITETGTYHISLSQMSTETSVTINMRLIVDESISVASVSGYISY